MLSDSVQKIPEYLFDSMYCPLPFSMYCVHSFVLFDSFESLFNSMYCVNGSLHLEESSNGSWSVRDLSERSAFCAGAFHYLKVSSIPMGVMIVVMNVLAYNTISK